MKIKEFLEKYGEVEITEDKEKELKELLNIKENENKKWKPEVGEQYHYLNDIGDTLVDTFATFPDDNYRVETNNCFKTEEEAEFRLEQIKVYNKLKNFADENNDKIDWNTADYFKYIIVFDYYCKEMKIFNCTTTKQIGAIYFSSEELANQAIEQVGKNRIKKYLFEVKE